MVCLGWCDHPEFPLHLYAECLQSWSAKKILPDSKRSAHLGIFSFLSTSQASNQYGRVSDHWREGASMSLHQHRGVRAPVMQQAMHKVMGQRLAYFSKYRELKKDLL
jgi:hypothetical protein